jgi:hypothetical protein
VEGMGNSCSHCKRKGVDWLPIVSFFVQYFHDNCLFFETFEIVIRTIFFFFFFSKS